ANQNNSEIDIAVSQTSDPTGSWNLYAVGTDYGNHLLDQPKLGVSNDKAVMTWNKNGFSGPYDFLVLQKSDLMAGATTPGSWFHEDGSHYNVIPAVTIGSSNDEFAASINRGSGTLTI